MPYTIEIDGTKVPFSLIRFPAGESHPTIKLPQHKLPNYVKVKCLFTPSTDIFQLALIVDSIKRQLVGSDTKLILDIPYFPAARQDRVANVGESLSVKVYADFVNSLGFDQVIIDDPHSEVVTALLNNVVVTNNHDFVYATLGKISMEDNRINLVVPDAGATKKATALTQFLTEKGYYVNIIQCEKVRSTLTGALTGFKILTDKIPNLPSILVDDICDGGGTFLGTAKAFREKEDITKGLYLVITHGIFTKGIEVFDGVYDEVFFKNDLMESNS